jgi:hypothetical protein
LAPVPARPDSLFADAGLISDDDGQRFAQDLEALNRDGHFTAAFVIRTATGTTS